MVTAGLPRNDGIDPSELHFQLLQKHSSNGRIGSDRQEYPPMLLGLWDAVGVVHELSGYCNDLVACINQFKSERELEVSAVDQIEQISRLLELNGAVMAGNYAAQTVREGASAPPRQSLAPHMGSQGKALRGGEAGTRAGV